MKHLLPSKWTDKKSISGYISPKLVITDEHNIYLGKRYANRNNNNYSWYSLGNCILMSTGWAIENPERNWVGWGVVVDGMGKFTIWVSEKL